MTSAKRPRPEDYLELAKVILEQGDAFLPQALLALEAGSHRLGPVASLTMAAVALDVRGGDHASALVRLDAAPSVLRQTPAWETRRGEILMQAGRHLEAQAAFTEALTQWHNLPSHRRSAPALASLEEKLREYLSAPVPNSSGANP